MQALTRRVLHHKRAVAIAWLLLTIIGMGAAGPATEALDQRFSVPGREGWDTSERIAKEYGNGGDSLPFVPVVVLPQGTPATSVRSELQSLEDKVAAAVPGSRVAGYASTGSDAFISKDGRTTFIYAFPKRSDEPFGANADAQEDLRDALKGETIAGAPVKITGYDALFEASGEDTQGTGVLLEAVLGGAGALLVLVFVFGSWLALVPIAMAISSILVSFLLLLGLTTFVEISPVVQFLVALVGLGISIDYALLVVVRWREEIARHGPGDEAVVAAMGTAGRAVVFSGTTVAVGLLALIVVPMPFLRSMGYGGMLIPLVATLAAITLLPVILATVGPRMDRRRIRKRDRSDHFWQRWSEGVVRFRRVAIVVALAILGFLIYSATDLHLGNSDPNTIAKGGPAKDALVSLQDSGIGAGAISPTETIVPKGEAQAVADAQAKVSDVHGAAAPSGQAWERAGNSIAIAMPRYGDERQEGRDAVQNLIDAAHEASPAARVGGSGPLNADFIDAAYGSFPLIIGLISFLTFVLLARAFRSIVLPAKAIVLNVLSIGAAWGVMTLIWQNGHGSSEIWGIDPTGSIASWIPFMVFAFLYGLSMDYEVFILARMREEYDTTGSTDEAVVRGIGRTGRLVTSAALILFLAFMSLASGPETDVKVLATGLAAGILLDATVIRALLVPAVVSLFGRWNWVLPTGAAKLLRVEPSLPPRTVPEPAAS
jgi:RND superfamily putative drug exporter